MPRAKCAVARKKRKNLIMQTLLGLAFCYLASDESVCIGTKVVSRMIRRAHAFSEHLMFRDIGLRIIGASDQLVDSMNLTKHF